VVTVATLPLPPGATELSLPVEINDRGEAAGTAFIDGRARPVLWHDGEVDVMVPPSGADAGARAISERGEIVGVPAFRWKDGVWTDLPAPPGVTGGQARDVNERGQVIGFFSPQQPGAGDFVAWQRDNSIVLSPTTGGTVPIPVDINNRGEAATGQLAAFRWTIGGDLTLLGDLGGGFAAAQAINDRGEVAGTSATADHFDRAYLWRDGSMVDLGTLGGPNSFMGEFGANDLVPLRFALNERGHVVGRSEVAGADSATQHAFLARHGEMVDLGTLGGASSVATAVNDHDQVVGRAITADGQEVHSFVWDDGTMVDLDVVAGLAPFPFEQTRTVNINNRGQILGAVVNGAGTVLRVVVWTVR
jgi:probable HAF family extracellular repeat protein